MKSKQQTPLGYLMGLLDVSLADLGDYLYVAQTSISKWKTGARPLKPTSQHFAGIVEYFAMLARDPERQERMVQLFARLYPDQPVDTPQQMAACVRSFLGGKQLPPVTLQQALSEEGRLYTAEVGVYGGESGEESAFGQLLGYLAAMEPGTLSVANRCGPLQAARFIPALDRGHKLRLLIDPPDAALPLSGLALAFAHAGTETRLMPAGVCMPPESALYLAGKDMLLLANAPPGHTAMSAIYTDALMLEHCQHGFDALWQAAGRVFSQMACERLGPELYRQMEETTVPEPLDWLAPSLPYLTMSRSLLMEVLRANDVSGRVWTHVLGGCDALAWLSLRVFVPAQSLRAPPDVQPTLSVLCGKTIRMSQAQRKRHMLDTAALLRAERLRVIPLQGDRVEIYGHLSAFVKRNAYAGYLNYAAATVQYTREAEFISAMMAAMDNIEDAATNEMRSAAYIASLLERVALENTPL